MNLANATYALGKGQDSLCAVNSLMEIDIDADNILENQIRSANFGILQYKQSYYILYGTNANGVF